ARGRTLHDLRRPQQTFRTGTGKKRSGRRLLMVGTDCAVGKKYSALAIDRELRRRGVPSTFCPTGQTGIMITGRGIAIDSVVADFIAGAAEWLSPDAAPDHWHVIEGQGALLHPAYAGVTLGLVHGSQPDALVICHEAGRRELQGYEGDYPCPSLTDALAVHVAAARLTSLLGEDEARAAIRAAEAELGLPACDPIRFGPSPIVDHLLDVFA
ncbi:MAG: NAD-dependent epimerase/dehydratase family protein, partial [Sphingomonadaceae bacterium]|nr:NAD-dependent epimerase/dehydratase family protein [Sphingomonadaceae bacterium]